MHLVSCGQERVLQHMERHAFDRTHVCDLLLCTDGASTMDTSDPVRLATAVFAVMDVHGIDVLLRDRRSLERTASSTAHTKQCEVTAVWIRFDE